MDVCCTQLYLGWRPKCDFGGCTFRWCQLCSYGLWGACVVFGGVVCVTVQCNACSSVTLESIMQLSTGVDCFYADVTVDIHTIHSTYHTPAAPNQQETKHFRPAPSACTAQ